MKGSSLHLDRKGVLGVNRESDELEGRILLCVSIYIIAVIILLESGRESLCNLYDDGSADLETVNLGDFLRHSAHSKVHDTLAVVVKFLILGKDDLDVLLSGLSADLALSGAGVIDPEIGENTLAAETEFPVEICVELDVD